MPEYRNTYTAQAMTPVPHLVIRTATGCQLVLPKPRMRQVTGAATLGARRWGTTLGLGSQQNVPRCAYVEEPRVHRTGIPGHTVFRRGL